VGETAREWLTDVAVDRPRNCLFGEEALLRDTPRKGGGMAWPGGAVWRRVRALRTLLATSLTLLRSGREGDTLYLGLCSSDPGSGTASSACAESASSALSSLSSSSSKAAAAAGRSSKNCRLTAEVAERDGEECALRADAMGMSAAKTGGLVFIKDDSVVLLWIVKARAVRGRPDPDTDGAAKNCSAVPKRREGEKVREGEKSSL
jgi:hypothetical protein